MEYLTNEKLLKQQQSSLFSINNSRSNSVSRFPMPSQRNSHEPSQPLRSADLFNRLEDILKQKQQSTTARKKQKQVSCILNQDIKKCSPQDNYYKSPIVLQEATSNGFLNVYNIEKSRRQINHSPNFQCQQKKKTLENQDCTSITKKECFKKFKDEFNNMQQKIKSRNNSILYQGDQEKNEGLDRTIFKENKSEINTICDSKTLNKLNQQLQLQNSHLQEQLLFEQNQNTKLNLLINNLNEQVTQLNKQLHDQKKIMEEDQQIKETKIFQLKKQIEQFETLISTKENQITDYLKQIDQFSQVYKDMQELEKLCEQFTYIGAQLKQHNILVLEVKELVQIQSNILEKIINRKDFPIDQLIISKCKKKPFEQSNQDCQTLAQSTTNILESVVKQIRAGVDTMTERFIHDLLI